MQRPEHLRRHDQIGKAPVALQAPATATATSSGGLGGSLDLVLDLLQLHLQEVVQSAGGVAACLGLPPQRVLRRRQNQQQRVDEGPVPSRLRAELHRRTAAAADPASLLLLLLLSLR